MKILFLAAAVAAATLCAAGAQAQKKPRPPATPAFQLEQGAAAADGKRVGKWNFYTRQQELELTFDYDSSRIAYQQPDTARYLVKAAGHPEWVLKKPARAPRVLGSTDQRLAKLLGSLRYPINALRQQLQGTVVVAYTVDTDGHSRDYTIEKSLSSDCDQEVWRALQGLPDNWVPAIYLGRLTPARFYLTVHFQVIDEADFDRQKRDHQKPVALLAGAAPSPSPAPAQPRYTHEVFVTGVAIRTSY